MCDKEIWKNRRSCRYFDTTKSVDPYDVDKVIGIMDYVPQQRGGVPANLWFVLGPDKQELKDYIFWNCAWHDEGYLTTGVEDTHEHFMSIKTAPYLFLACRSEEIDKDRSSELTLFDRNNGFMAGVMVTTILHLGYNASQIACFEGNNKIKENRKLFTEKLWKHFDKSKLDPLIEMNVKKAIKRPQDYNGTLVPKLAIGMGYKNETMDGDDNEWAWIEGYENKSYFIYGRKKTLKHSGVIQ